MFNSLTSNFTETFMCQSVTKKLKFHIMEDVTCYNTPQYITLH